MLKNTLYALALIMALVAPPGGRASPYPPLGSQVAILIQFGDGRYLVKTVEWTESMTGMELLLATGLPVLATPTGFVCRIASDGCTPPAEACPCNGANWGYWYWAENEWKYAPVGASGRLAPNGGIDGWVFGWGKNSPPPAIEPDALFDVERLTPSLPQITWSPDGNLDAQVSFSGDANENATVSAQYRIPGENWSEPPISLARAGNIFSGRLARNLTPGDYETRLTYADPDGVNGSVTWIVEVTVQIEYKLYLPIMQATTF